MAGAPGGAPKGLPPTSRKGVGKPPPPEGFGKKKPQFSLGGGIKKGEKQKASMFAFFKRSPGGPPLGRSLGPPLGGKWRVSRRGAFSVKFLREKNFKPRVPPDGEKGKKEAFWGPLENLGPPPPGKKGGLPFLGGGNNFFARFPHFPANSSGGFF